MNTIEILSALAVIIWRVLALSPHGPGSLVKLELVYSLSQTVESLRGKEEVHLNELVHHHK